MFLNIIMSIKNEITAVFKNKAIVSLNAKLMLNFVLQEMCSVSTIKWMTFPMMNLLNSTISQITQNDKIFTTR